jgi:hypothetical protein
MDPGPMPRVALSFKAKADLEGHFPVLIVDSVERSPRQVVPEALLRVSSSLVCVFPRSTLSSLVYAGSHTFPS